MGIPIKFPTDFVIGEPKIQFGEILFPCDIKYWEPVIPVICIKTRHGGCVGVDKIETMVPTAAPYVSPVIQGKVERTPAYP